MPRTGAGPNDRELFRRHPANPILSALDWPYPANAVFNPAAAEVDGTTVLLARVEDMTGISHLTVARSANGVDGWKIEPNPCSHPWPELTANSGDSRTRASSTSPNSSAG